MPSTSLRRAVAAVGERNGLYWLGACGKPASSADSASVSSEAGLLKYERAAAWMPIACLPPFVP